MGRQRSFAPFERDIQATVVEYWRVLGMPDTLVAAIPNARAHGQPGLTKGLPDLMVLGPRVPNECAFIELKRERGASTSDEQLAFGALSARLGLTWKLAHGVDAAIELLELWGVVRVSKHNVERRGLVGAARGAAGVEENKRRGV